LAIYKKPEVDLGNKTLLSVFLLNWQDLNTKIKYCFKSFNISCY